MISPIVLFVLAGLLDSFQFWKEPIINTNTTAFDYHQNEVFCLEKNKQAQEVQEVQKNTKPLLTSEIKQQLKDRINAFSVEIGSPLGNKYGDVWVEVGIKYNRHPYSLVAIAFADTTLGKNLTTAYNIGNVGNTDTCINCQSYTSWEQGIEAIAQTLTNKYLRNATRLCHLSKGGWVICPEGAQINNGYFYASSPGNWNRNSIWAESWLHGSEWHPNHSIILSDYYQLD